MGDGYMNAYERMMNRIAGKPVDRVPNMNLVMFFAARETGNHYGEVIRNGKLLAEGMLRCYEKYGIDCLHTISDSVREVEDLGAEVVIPLDGVPYLKKPFIAEASDFSRLHMVRPEDGRAMSDRVESVRWLKERAGMDAAVVGWVEGAYAAACNFTSVQDFMYMLMDEPEEAHELIEFCYELETEFALAQVRAGADIIGMGDAAASLIGPALYREFAFEPEKRMIEAIHAAGAKVKTHICGNINPIMADIAQTGCDIMDCDHMVDFRRAGELMRGRGCVCGNFNPVTVAFQGTEQDVYDASIACATCCDNSIVAAGCEIPLKTDPANLLACHRALVDLAAR